MNDNTQRFSNRVDNYVKYRPDYPKEIIVFLEKEIGFNKDFILADIGSGTGILTQMFLENGNKVYAVEPNEQMRSKAEKLLNINSNFVSVDGTAEQTTLQDASINLITAAQAFHWFDIPKTKVEFKRILKANDYCCLIWNERLVNSSFETAYEQLLFDYSLDYSKVDHKNINEDVIASFYDPEKFTEQSFHNKQVFNFDSLKGRLLSSSYAPDENHPKHHAMIEQLQKIFDELNKDGVVEFRYETKVFLGKL